MTTGGHAFGRERRHSTPSLEKQGAQSAAAAMVVAAPKPHLVKLAISAEGEDWFMTGGARHKATR